MAYEDFRGNVAAVHRARTAALAGEATAAGVPIADHLLAGWAGAESVALRTLQLAFSRETSRAQRAYWKHGEKARRDHRTYGERAITHLIC
jgi:putative transposase